MNQASNNRLKDELLGEPHGTANGRLKKMLIFNLAGRLGLLDCYRCGKLVETIETLSIEHKDPWQRAVDPRASFFDLDNIAFSHLRCNTRVNTSATSRSLRAEQSRSHGTHAMYLSGCRCSPCRQGQAKSVSDWRRRQN